MKRIASRQTKNIWQTPRLLQPFLIRLPIVSFSTKSDSKLANASRLTKVSSITGRQSGSNSKEKQEDYSPRLQAAIDVINRTDCLVQQYCRPNRRVDDYGIELIRKTFDHLQMAMLLTNDRKNPQMQKTIVNFLKKVNKIKYPKTSAKKQESAEIIETCSAILKLLFEDSPEDYAWNFNKIVYWHLINDGYVFPNVAYEYISLLPTNINQTLSVNELIHQKFLLPTMKLEKVKLLSERFDAFCRVLDTESLDSEGAYEIGHDLKNLEAFGAANLFLDTFILFVKPKQLTEEYQLIKDFIGHLSRCRWLLENYKLNLLDKQQEQVTLDYLKEVLYYSEIFLSKTNCFRKFHEKLKHAKISFKKRTNIDLTPLESVINTFSQENSKVAEAQLTEIKQKVKGINSIIGNKKRFSSSGANVDNDARLQKESREIIAELTNLLEMAKQSQSQFQISCFELGTEALPLLTFVDSQECIDRYLSIMVSVFNDSFSLDNSIEQIIRFTRFQASLIEEKLTPILSTHTKEKVKKSFSRFNDLINKSDFDLVVKFGLDYAKLKASHDVELTRVLLIRIADYDTDYTYLNDCIAIVRELMTTASQSDLSEWGRYVTQFQEKWSNADPFAEVSFKSFDQVRQSADLLNKFYSQFYLLMRNDGENDKKTIIRLKSTRRLLELIISELSVKILTEPYVKENMRNKQIFNVTLKAIDYFMQVAVNYNLRSNKNLTGLLMDGCRNHSDLLSVIDISKLFKIIFRLTEGPDKTKLIEMAFPKFLKMFEKALEPGHNDKILQIFKLSTAVLSVRHFYAGCDYQKMCKLLKQLIELDVFRANQKCQYLCVSSVVNLWDYFLTETEFLNKLLDIVNETIEYKKSSSMDRMLVVKSSAVLCFLIQATPELEKLHVQAKKMNDKFEHIFNSDEQARNFTDSMFVHESSSQMVLYSLLERHNLDFESEVFLHISKIDALVKPNIVIEVLGSVHFIEDRLDNFTRAKTKIFQHLGYRVFNIHTDILESSEKKIPFINEVLRTLKSQEESK